MALERFTAGSATPQPRVMHLVVAAQSPVVDQRATHATPLAAVGEVCPGTYLHVSRRRTRCLICTPREPLTGAGLVNWRTVTARRVGQTGSPPSWEACLYAVPSGAAPQRPQRLLHRPLATPRGKRRSARSGPGTWAATAVWTCPASPRRSIQVRGTRFVCWLSPNAVVDGARGCREDVVSGDDEIPVWRGGRGTCRALS